MIDVVPCLLAQGHFTSDTPQAKLRNARLHILLTLHCTIDLKAEAPAILEFNVPRVKLPCRGSIIPHMTALGVEHSFLKC